MYVNKKLLKKRIVAGLLDHGYLVLRPISLFSHPYLLAEKNNKRVLIAHTVKKDISDAALSRMSKAMNNKKLMIDSSILVTYMKHGKRTKRRAKLMGIKLIHINKVDRLSFR